MSFLNESSKDSKEVLSSRSNSRALATPASDDANARRIDAAKIFIGCLTLELSGSINREAIDLSA
jgi:hypothetical protein